MAAPEQKPGKVVQDASLAQAKQESQWRSIARRFFRNKAAALSLVVLILLYLVAIFAPHLAKEPMDFLDVVHRNLAPSWTHPMGTDNLGRDVLSRIIWGSRVSLSIGLVAMGMSVFIGTLVGSIAGFYAGSWLDIFLIHWVAESIESIPTYFLLITIVAVIRPNIFNVMMVIGITSWPGVARLVRGEFLTLRQRDFAEACRALGAKDSRLIFRHILPNAVAPIIVSATLRVGGAILMESGLSFLGLGTQPPQTSWGQLLNVGREYLRQAPWVAIWPGVPILVTVLAFNYVGDGLRDALDPRMKR